MVQEIAKKAIENKAAELSELSRKIWENPEIAFNEYKASAWTADFLKEEGFDVELEYAGLPTAIKATWGSGKPVIGFLGEYDALPGMNQNISTQKEASLEGAPAKDAGTIFWA